MTSCKFLAFSDLHHEPQVFPHDAESYLQQILNRADAEEVSFVVQLGDFLHTPEFNSALADIYADHPLPTYNVFGNHDTDQENYDYILRMYRLERGYYHFDRDGYRFIVLDPNYCRNSEGDLIHYAPKQTREHYRGTLPQEQLDWLQETISESPHPCVIFSHQSLERTDGFSNRDDVWRIICRANCRKEHSVILCINGHYHCDYCTFVNGVCCLDLNSSSYHWTEAPNNLYPQEFYEKFPLSRNSLLYDSPLSAVITLEGTDRITVSGAAGKFRFSPTREDVIALTEYRRLCLDRLCVPYISDYRIDLKKNSVERFRKE
ncbi:MAG: metallophosphoesterase [Clostridia bacterium]|nr:metallophosphoesterase [Clostridia bacterium]